MGIDEFGDAGRFAIGRGHRDEFRPENVVDKRGAAPDPMTRIELLIGLNQPEAERCP
jgi:hypothetical protein